MMFNALIADDEELERRAIKNIIINNFPEEFNIYEAKNGREAIEVAERIRPDLVIIDIKMPGINGIEAIKEMYKNLPESYFMIVTAYDYFNYAKEAIQHNVRQYILKPFNREDFASKISDAIDYLKRIYNRRSRELELKERLYSMEPAIKNELSSSIIYNRLSLIDYNQYQESINIDLSIAYSMVVKFLEGPGYNISHIKDDIEELAKDKSSFLAYSQSRDKLVLFCSHEEGGNNEKSGEYLAREIRKLLRDRYKLNSYVGIGNLSYDILNLNYSYNEAEKAIEYCTEQEKIRHFNNIKLDNLFESDTDELLEDNSQKIISEAVDFIKRNYNREINLDIISKKINVSPFYFSRCFKELMGVSFIEYLTECRIQKAKNLLKRGKHHIKEVCYEVGYSDPNYFSRVFKKLVGVSPTEYKNKI